MKNLKVNSLKVLLCLGIIVCFRLSTSGCRLFAQEKIVAIVNKDVITKKDLNDFINFISLQMQDELKGEELANKIQAMKTDLLGKLIDDRLIFQEAMKSNLGADENRIKARIEEIKKHYASDGEFQHALSLQGLTQADIESRIREQLLMHGIIETKIRSKIVVKPSEITDFYQKDIEDFNTPEVRELTSIKITDENIANTVFKGLKEGVNLDDLVNKYSLEVNKITVSGNDELRKEIKDAIFGLDVKGISPPVKINDGLYIFILDGIIPPRQQSLSEAQAKIYNYIFNTRMQEELAKWLDELKKSAYIKIFSD